jgi:RluA family pseudouridine synthase
VKPIRFPDLILLEDRDYILINKPPFVATLEDRNDPQNILRLAKQYSEDSQVCHRLDKDTSGVLAIAKNPEAYRHLSMQFEGREVTKTYHAVVDGIHQFENEMVDAPILKQNDGTVKISRQGKDALTYFTTLKVYKYHSLVECTPVTGRTHQIRIHLSRLNASITGDDTYGGKPFFVSSVKRGFKMEKNAEEQPLIKRMALHAFSLEFMGLSKEMSVQAPYPRDFQALLKQLSQNLR